MQIQDEQLLTWLSRLTPSTMQASLDRGWLIIHCNSDESAEAARQTCAQVLPIGLRGYCIYSGDRQFHIESFKKRRL